MIQIAGGKTAATSKPGATTAAPATTKKSATAAPTTTKPQTGKGNTIAIEMNNDSFIHTHNIT